MWLREKNAHNMVVNDPKGELLVKNYIPAVTRGLRGRAVQPDQRDEDRHLQPPGDGLRRHPGG